MKHINNGHCEKCEEILDRYPGFHEELRTFFRWVQSAHPEAHVSCGGRGRIDQEDCFRKSTSLAHWGESAHNYNAALDWFRLTEQGASFDTPWFKQVIGPEVKKWNEAHSGCIVRWYGEPGSPFLEYPHCEVSGWRMLKLPLVEKG